MDRAHQTMNNDGVQIKDIAGVLPDIKKEGHDIDYPQRKYDLAYMQGFNFAISEISGKRIGLNREKLIGTIHYYLHGTTDKQDIELADAIIASQSQIIECKE